jgi:SAM-dependent methyltransferase
MGFERLSPGTIEWDAYYANHIFRYQFAMQQLVGQNKMKVLDAACGVGFGSQYLAMNGIKKIIAIDRNEKALRIAKDEFAHSAVTYIQDDCHTLINASSYGLFDAVVSMETLEHLPDPHAFLKSCYALLVPGGLLIVSTPNAAVSSPNGEIKWEFHEKEYTTDELNEILVLNGFINIQLFGQSYSAIGRLRDAMRAELNKINSNPFARVGRYLQKVARGLQPASVLPEKIEDFQIVSGDSMNSEQPFVLLAMGYKP